MNGVFRGEQADAVGKAAASAAFDQQTNAVFLPEYVAVYGVGIGSWQR